MKATYLGHSAVLLEAAGRNILIDPFLTDNPKASAKPADINADFVLVTHDHEDHIGDTEYFLRQGATFVGIHELATRFAGEGYKTEGMNIGGSITIGGIRISMTHALHTSYTGHVVGFIIEAEGKCVHHAGDTGISMDMTLLKEFFSIDLAFLPIGDRYTMGSASAARAAEMMGAKKVVPIHYGTWPPIEGDPNDFARRLGDRAIMMKPGESITV